MVLLSLSSLSEHCWKNLPCPVPIRHPAHLGASDASKGLPRRGTQLRIRFEEFRTNVWLMPNDDSWVAETIDHTKAQRWQKASDHAIYHRNRISISVGCQSVSRWVPATFPTKIFSHASSSALTLGSIDILCGASTCQIRSSWQQGFRFRKKLFF